MKGKEPSKFMGLIIPVIVALFNVFILLFPNDVISASKFGINLWFNNVFPSLIPFLIGTNILTAVGFVSFVGTLLEPIMYPIFGVPGCGGFALVTGMTSGYPMGAKITATLREKNELSHTEAQRLISFVNNSGPLFIVGAVGIGMFSNVKIGYFILIAHYLSAIVTGLIFKYYKFTNTKPPVPKGNVLSRAFKNMQLIRQKDPRGFGEILGDSIKKAMETIAVIGGFIILFCVIVKIIEITNFVSLTSNLLNEPLQYFGITQDLYKGFFYGLIEITNGSKILAANDFSKTQLVLATAVISFGGFSIHAQAMSFIGKTDIKISVYLIAKLIHGVIAATTASLIFPLFDFAVDATTKETSPSSKIFEYGFIDTLAWSSVFFVSSLCFILGLIILFNIFANTKRKKRIKF